MLILVAAYDSFAWFYEHYWNDEFHGAAFPVLERIWLDRLPGSARILDVCCGAGRLAKLLTARGYRVTGVDASAEMLRYAREAAPEAEFLHADASEFRVQGSFDGAVSTFDSLNHILDRGALAAAFRNTADALSPGGLFAFDMLLEEAYRTHWGESFAIVRDDHVLTITGAAYSARTRRAQCQLTMFRLLNDHWERSDVLIRERSYTTREIESIAGEAGFGELLCYDASDLGIAGNLGEGRTFFVAKKL